MRKESIFDLGFGMLYKRKNALLTSPDARGKPFCRSGFARDDEKFWKSSRNLQTGRQEWIAENAQSRSFGICF
jgi:hypothetical protein